jgi:hypothetical protein
MIEGDWSSGMIPASGAGGREFDSRITPFFFFLSGAGSLEAWRFVTNTNYSPPNSPLAPLLCPVTELILSDSARCYTS